VFVSLLSIRKVRNRIFYTGETPDADGGNKVDESVDQGAGEDGPRERGPT
jgi:hypothetical protein